MSRIHHDIKFMVISNNQNLNFKIQCQKQNNNNNSFHDIFDTTNNSHNNMNMEIIVEVCTSLVY